MAYLPPDNWDEYDAVLETATTTALQQWFTNHVNPNLRPTLVAATNNENEDGQPPTYNLGALLAATAAWLALWDEVVEPTTVGLLAIRAASTLQGMDTPLDKATTASAPQGALTQLRAALQAVRNAGGTTPNADDIEWVVRVPGWQDFINKHARARRNMVVGMPDTVHRDLVTKLAAAARSGDDMWERYRLVRGYLSWEDEGGYDQWMIRARRIARTEAANITNAADLQAARTSAQALGQEMHKVWLCVAPDTVVGSGAAHLAARRHYEGPMVRITTASGRSLSLTPEHPVLTGRGWTVAGDLDLTDNLFQVVGAKATGAPDVQDAPPGIGEVVDAAIDLAPAKVRAMRTGVDFNGHPVAGNVEVVPVDGQLALDLESAVTENVRNLHFTDADVLAHGLALSGSGAGSDLAGNGAASHLLPGEGMPGGLSGGLLPGGTKDTGSSPVPDGDALLAEEPGHHVVTGVQPCRNCGCGQPVHVSTRYVPGVNVSTSAGLDREPLGGTGLLDGGGVALEAEAGAVPPLADGHAAFTEPAGHGGTAGADGAGDLPEGMSGLVEPDDLVNIERYTFVGHVYDLSTAAQWYEANGLVVHNCTLDSRTRDTHYQLDGKRIPIDAKFMVGGHEADRPSDDRLPAHENINCRCTLMFVAAGEDVPDDTDRQTERERTRNHQPVPARDPQDEVRHRARRGVTRAGDTGAHTITAATQNGDTPMRTQWTGTLAPVGKPTGDGRIFDTDAELGFREFPLPLMFQRATSDGHDTAVIVGKITSATVDGGGVQAVGEFFDSGDAAEAAELVGEGVLRPSVDLADMEVEWELVDADGNAVDPEENEYEDGWREVMHVRAATVIAATLVAKPAFAEAKIVVGEATESPADAEGEEAALVAAAALADVDTHPAAAFTDPNLTAPTPLTVTDEGHVYGHLALWGTEHVGMPGKGITPPRSRTNYALFHTSTARTTEGDLPVGRLTVGTGHANARAGVHDTTAHYDNTGTAWALVRAGEDAHGIWVAGVTCPDVDPASVRAGASAPLSGDWRNVGGNLELVAALSVNTPGFPVPRSYAATTGAELSLVAAGVTPRRSRLDEWADAVAEGLRRHDERKALAEDEAFEQAERLAATRRMAAKVWAMEVNK